MIELKTLGVLRTDFMQKFGTPRQGSLAKSSRGRVELEAQWRGRGIFVGLEGFSHVWLITYLHLNGQLSERGKIHPPRLRGGKVGILASRSPHRPNNIGLTLAKIEKCIDDELWVSEIDLVDGTPILDIKPYVAEADRPLEYKNGWLEGAQFSLRECEFLETAMQKIKALPEPDRFKSLIFEMLSLDPRSPAYLGKEQVDFYVWVDGYNVSFEYRDEKFFVKDIEPLA